MGDFWLSGNNRKGRSRSGKVKAEYEPCTCVMDALNIYVEKAKNHQALHYWCPISLIVGIYSSVAHFWGSMPNISWPVPNCSGTGGSGHEFPRNRKRNAWRVAIRRAKNDSGHSWWSCKNSIGLVCAKHFVPSDYEEFGKCGKSANETVGHTVQIGRVLNFEGDMRAKCEHFNVTRMLSWYWKCIAGSLLYGYLT